MEPYGMEAHGIEPYGTEASGIEAHGMEAMEWIMGCIRSLEVNILNENTTSSLIWAQKSLD